MLLIFFLKISLFIAFVYVNALQDLDGQHPLLSTTQRIKNKKNNLELSAQYWFEKAQTTLTQKILFGNGVNKNNAKNVIMFVGDGMSVHTITATRNFIGDSKEEIFFEKFPYVGLSKTYAVDSKVADSASTATAYLGGVKSSYGTIGVNANVKRGECLTSQNPINWVESIAKWFQDANKSTGLVTTTRVTHASPAGLYAHTAERQWENDNEVRKSGCNPQQTIDIARQLVEWPVGRKLNVIMGGGRADFYDKTQTDMLGLPGKRSDGRNLIKTWLEDKRSRNFTARYVWNRSDLQLINLQNTDYLMGLFSNSHCPFHGDLKRKNLTLFTPSLSEMTVVALKVLKKNQNGFFLFVEGGRIDMAHHETQARKALEDTQEFAKAVQLARNMFSENDTLIVVTSDHSHTMSINGYPERGQDINGLSNRLANDNLPFTILSYANGLGYFNTYSKEGRKPVTMENVKNPNFKYLATAPLQSETHGGDDVAVFASGPYAHYFSGNYEQNFIPAVMAKAANIGPHSM